MAKERHTHIIDGSFGRSGLAMKHLTRQEFGKRLYSAMLRKGWSQAELARRAGVLRDSISNYVRGNNMPDAVNLNKMAEALGMKPEELLPNMAEQALELDTAPSLEVRASGSDPNKSWLRLNRLVKTSTVGKVIALLEADNAPD